MSALSLSMPGSKRKVIIAFSVIGLLLSGHTVALLVADWRLGWLYTSLYYAAWIIASILVLVTSEELKQLFRIDTNRAWYLLPSILALPLFIYIFIPNRHVFELDALLVFHILLCLINPFLEEIYWRGLVSKFSRNTVVSFMVSTTGFAASHPLVFGVNSVGASGWIAFAGTWIVGAALWICYYKTRSLRGSVLAHLLIDFAGMGAYVLANKLQLMKFPF
jgi:uncharacterized protein